MIDFDAPDLAKKIEKLTTIEIDALPFGVVRLDDALRVVFYSKTEGRLSGYGSRPVLGRIFFTEIAPCMNTAEFAGRIAAARSRGTLDLEFAWTGDFADPKREIHVRIQSASDRGVWIFLSRNPESITGSRGN